MRMRNWILLFVGLVVGFSLHAVLSPRDTAPQIAPATGASAPTEWTCSMHPQVRQQGPGDCPLCGMDLIPVGGISEEASDAGPRGIRLSERARRLGGVRTATVERRFVETTLPLQGRVDFDESRLAHITARFPGRLERLFVDFTGVKVKKGEHLVEIYSPELLTAQEELIQATQTVARTAAASANLRESSLRTLHAAREKLRLWGLESWQISAIEKRGTVDDRLTLHSPLDGIVVHKNAVEGGYVKTGDQLYTIADLSKLWVILDAFESDLDRLRYGQQVTIRPEAFPGQSMIGTISFISPVLDERTRTVRMRVNLENREGLLKPGMFVRAEVQVRLSAHGLVSAPSLAGRWICSMHPEIVKDAPGKCDICGMPLVKWEASETVDPHGQEEQAPLVIPATAPLITGRRAIVYVATTDDEGLYEGREIVLGPRAGDWYIVREGLQPGEEVVVQGAFRVDSAVQLQAKPSMMNPDSEPLPSIARNDHSQHRY